MKTVTLNTDAQMPVIGLGTFLSSVGEVYKAVRWALKVGYRHIDCASIYDNQSEVGQALHDAIKEDGIKREELFITSKLWNDAHNIDDVKPACEQTLNELKLDYLDLYLMHWPVAQKKGTQMPKVNEDWVSLDEVPLWETYSEMEKLYNQGICKAIGVSNFNEEKLGKLISKTQVVPAVNQVECHPLLNQKDLINYCSENNISVTATFTSGNPGTRKIFNIIYPPQMRFGNNVLKKYTVAYCYGYSGNVPEKRVVKQRGYSHVKYEQYLLKRPTYLQDYLDRVISQLVYSHYINKKKDGQKLAVFFSTIEMVNEAYKWFKGQFKNLKVTKFIGGTKDDVLKTNDIIINMRMICIFEYRLKTYTKFTYFIFFSICRFCGRTYTRQTI
jgi:diketogulonate reductase-like aldo/keto reductase